MGRAENPALGALFREAIPDMALVTVPDPTAEPFGWRLYVEHVQPTTTITDALIGEIVDSQALVKTLGWEPKAEIEVHGAALTLTLRAENGTWTWRFGDYDPQTCTWQLAWPD